MENKKNFLLKISFAIALIGILLLLVLVNILPVKHMDIQDISPFLLNKKITISGEIFNIQNHDNFQVISIKDNTGKIDITLNKISDLNKGNKIQVTGKVKEYKQYLQIRAENIILV
jgi:DNA/RNA endonuclease YhcR with UshA esterase domain